MTESKQKLFMMQARTTTTLKESGNSRKVLLELGLKVLAGSNRAPQFTLGLKAELKPDKAITTTTESNLRQSMDMN